MLVYCTHSTGVACVSRIRTVAGRPSRAGHVTTLHGVDLRALGVRQRRNLTTRCSACASASLLNVAQDSSWPMPVIRSEKAKKWELAIAPPLEWPLMVNWTGGAASVAESGPVWHSVGGPPSDQSIRYDPSASLSVTLVPEANFRVCTPPDRTAGPNGAPRGQENSSAQPVTTSNLSKRF